MRKLVYGVGVNDADHVVSKARNGKTYWTCPFYQRWADMLRRCYSTKYKSRNESYSECYVCDEWLVFSNFMDWMKLKDWHDKEIDKDIIGDSKVYSPETCVFVSKIINLFIVDSKKSRGKYPLGVSYSKDKCKFRSYINSPITKKYEHIGYFNDPESAHEAWRARKLYYAKLLISMGLTDKPVSEALIKRYSNGATE